MLSEKMTVAACVIAPIKMSAHRWYRVAMRRQPLSLARRNAEAFERRAEAIAVVAAIRYVEYE